MSIGAEALIKKYGTMLDVAVALIRGELSQYDQDTSTQFLNVTLIAAAEAHIRLKEERLNRHLESFYDPT